MEKTNRRKLQRNPESKEENNRATSVTPAAET
jgi:hypothetical protein